jgi:hypothetical protein
MTSAMKPCVLLMGYRPDWTPRTPVLFGVRVRKRTHDYTSRNGNAQGATFVRRCANSLCEQEFATYLAEQRFCSPKCAHVANTAACVASTRGAVVPLPIKRDSL